MTVRDIDLGWRRIKRDLAKLRGAKAVVGIREENGIKAHDDEGGGLTIAEIATVHEFGAPSVRIPERPFLRDAFDRNEEKYTTILTNVVDQVLGGDLPVAKAPELVAIVCVGDVQEGIATPGRFAENAPATVARKGSTQPLIDTGRLRSSIDYALTGPAQGTKRRG